MLHHPMLAFQNRPHLQDYQQKNNNLWNSALHKKEKVKVANKICEKDSVFLPYMDMDVFSRKLIQTKLLKVDIVEK